LTFAPLHFGTWAGAWSKALYVLLGIAPGALFVTGFLMWWNRVAGKRYRAWRGRVQPAGTVLPAEAEPAAASQKNEASA
jgi:uncharacterized iron-regulated membrane protein